MALNEYRCSRCNESQYVFDKETVKQGNCGKFIKWCHQFELQPSNFTTLIATAQFMNDFMLDSWNSTMELDRVLNIEAREAKEAEMYQHFKKNK